MSGRSGRHERSGGRDRGSGRGRDRDGGSGRGRGDDRGRGSGRDRDGVRAPAGAATAIYGRNPVREALRGRRASAVGEIWATEATAAEPWLAGAQVRVARAEEIEARCGSSSHQGICAAAGPYPYADPDELLDAEEPLLVVLDHVQDPQNLGSICRTAECVGADGVLIHERGSAEVTPAVCKASAGAVEHLRIAKVRNVADFLADARRAGCWCYGATAPEPAGVGGRSYASPDVGARRGASQAPSEDDRAASQVVSYDEPNYGGGVVLVLGSEGRGLRPRVAAACDQLVTLPMRGRVQSLGVSAAASALLYRILQDRSQGP